MALTVLPSGVSNVRRFIEGFVTDSAERMGVAASLSGPLALTTHELLENVAKYAEDRHGVLRLATGSAEGQARVTITVTNKTAPAHIERLRSAFRELDETPDPMTHYLTLMAQKSARGEGGLGLARIRAEGGMQLSLAVEGHEVCVSATSELAGRDAENQS